VGHVTNAQIWTVIAVMSSMVGLIFAALRFSLGSLQRAIDARFDAVDARFDHERDFTAVRFGALEHRLDAIEADMSIIKSHLIGQRSA
jgi:hypothetical protein